MNILNGLFNGLDTKRSMGRFKLKGDLKAKLMKEHEMKFLTTPKYNGSVL